MNNETGKTNNQHQPVSVFKHRLADLLMCPLQLGEAVNQHGFHSELTNQPGRVRNGESEQSHLDGLSDGTFLFNLQCVLGANSSYKSSCLMSLPR